MEDKNKILIVDDNATNIAVLEEILADEYNVMTAISGEGCLAVVETFRPDLILLDIMMPGIDGYETCRRIRANATLKNVRIILVSAQISGSKRLKGCEVGADDYVTKPFGEKELLTKVRFYLRLKRVDQAAQSFPLRHRGRSM